MIPRSKFAGTVEYKSPQFSSASISSSRPSKSPVNINNSVSNASKSPIFKSDFDTKSPEKRNLNDVCNDDFMAFLSDDTAFTPTSLQTKKSPVFSSSKVAPSASYVERSSLVGSETKSIRSQYTSPKKESHTPTNVRSSDLDSSFDFDRPMTAGGKPSIKSSQSRFININQTNSVSKTSRYVVKADTDSDTLILQLSYFSLLIVILFDRCCRVVLSGSKSQRGLKVSSFSKVVCDSMRCMNCNFMVLCYSDAKWDGSADYMFFRNSVPSDEKLSNKLFPSDGSSAYCCQCSWIDTASDINIQSGVSQQQWMCIGH